MKNLIILGLLVLGLSSCGQSLDKTTFEDDGGTEHNTGTNYNKIQDIQDCLNGDRPACLRAVAEGFTTAPLFFEDLQETSGIEINGNFYSKASVSDQVIVFNHVEKINNYNGAYHLTMKTDVKVYPDYSVDVNRYWKWQHTNFEYIKPGTNFAADYLYDLDSGYNLEWKSHDSKTIHIEIIGNANVYR